MLSRFIRKPSNLRLSTLISSQTTYLSNPKTHIFHSPNPPIRKPIFHPHFFCNSCRYFSSNSNGNGNDKDQFRAESDVWKLSNEDDQSIDSVLREETGSLEGIYDGSEDANTELSTKAEDESLLRESEKSGVGDDIFEGIDEKGSGVADSGEEWWATVEGYNPWSLAEDKVEDVFDIEEVGQQMNGLTDGNELTGGNELEENARSQEAKQLEIEEKALSAVLKGPNRAFGDLIAASGITEPMLDSLIVLKDLEDIQGLPPLTEIEDMRYYKNTRKSTKSETEFQKQEEIAKSRVRQVDTKGRAYGTGKRKCSIARVWVQPGDGKFIVNDKQFDVYFPMLDQRASLLQPFVETKTLGLWDVNCTVKGGGVSGQVGAIQLGISRALQNWEPDLRPPLRKGGFLTRDSRVVERKKPGKAKARKSFQWVKR